MKMKDRTKIIFCRAEDIPVDEMIDALKKCKAELPEDSVNDRIRIYQDEISIPWKEELQDAALIELRYTSPMSEEEILEERQFLDRRKSEREARDKLNFQRIKNTYDWAK